MCSWQGARRYPFKSFLSDVEDAGFSGPPGSAAWDMFVEAELQSMVGPSASSKLSEFVLAYLTVRSVAMCASVLTFVFSAQAGVASGGADSSKDRKCI